jgi:hypothetical protein
MPLDPSIYAQIIKPEIVPLVSPQQREAQRVLIEQRQALADERREKLRQMREASLDESTINDAIQQSVDPQTGIPDFDQAISIAASRGRASAVSALTKLVDEHKTKAEAIAKQHLANQRDQIDLGLQTLNMTKPDGSNWPAVRKMALALADDPKSQEQLASVLPESYDAPTVEAVKQGALKTDQYFTLQQKAIEAAPKTYGEFKQQLAPVLAAAPTKEEWDNALDYAALVGGTAGKQMRAVFGEFSPESQAAALDKGKTAHEISTEAQQQLTNQRLAGAETRMETAATETARHNKEMERLGLIRATKPSAPQAGSSTAESDAKEIAQAIMRGEQPPELTGMYGKSAAIKAELARNHYDLTHALEDWNATKRYLNTLNGAQQTRLRQAVEFTAHSLDIVEDLNKQWQGGRFPLLNKAQLIAAKNGVLGKDAQRIATQLDAQIGDLVSELGTVYKGGNSSTDESLKLAAQNLSANWSQSQLAAAIDLTRKNLTIRQNSIKNVGPIGATPQNPYAPQQGAPDSTQKVRVKGKDGRTYEFPNQAAADNFKKAGG